MEGAIPWRKVPSMKHPTRPQAIVGLTGIALLAGGIAIGPASGTTSGDSAATPTPSAEATEAYTVATVDPGAQNADVTAACATVRTTLDGLKSGDEAQAVTEAWAAATTSSGLADDEAQANLLTAIDDFSSATNEAAKRLSNLSALPGVGDEITLETNVWAADFTGTQDYDASAVTTMLADQQQMQDPLLGSCGINWSGELDEFGAAS